MFWQVTFLLESGLGGVRLSCALTLSPRPIAGCPSRTVLRHVFGFIARREKNWGLIMDGANQLDKMTAHLGFSTELLLHFFSDYKTQVLLFLSSPPAYVYSLVFLGFGLSSNKNEG